MFSDHMYSGASTLQQAARSFVLYLLKMKGGVPPSPVIHLSRLKMGICEGSPASIMPDHMGRADYHGTSINQAARIMDAGAPR